MGFLKVSPRNQQVVWVHISDGYLGLPLGTSHNQAHRLEVHTRVRRCLIAWGMWTGCAPFSQKANGKTEIGKDMKSGLEKERGPFLCP